MTNKAHTATTRVTDLWTTVRSEARAHRAARAHHRELRDQLASYTTPAEIDDLLAVVDGSDAESTEIREILLDNRAGYARRSRLAG